MSSRNRTLLKFKLLKAAFFAAFVFLVSCSSKQAASPFLGLVSLPARFTPFVPHELPPIQQPVDSSSRLKSPSPTQLASIAGDVPNKTDFESDKFASRGLLASALSIFSGRDLSQTTSETEVKSPPTARSQRMQQVIGYSVEKRPITGYYFGHGQRTVVFVGGIHGGYEWNTILLAYQAIDYFTNHPAAIPEDVTLIIIPSANPDGQYRITGIEGRFEQSDVPSSTAAGRFNVRGVDLNRNWDCDWELVGWWGDQAVSGGKKPFSEPESRALRDFFIEQKPDAVVFWHSKAGGVFSGGCQGPFAPSQTLAGVYSSASGYPAEGQFAYYEVTGEASDWLSAQGISSFTVELSSHDQIEWSENLAGMIAVLNYSDQPDRRVSRVE